MKEEIKRIHNSFLCFPFCQASVKSWEELEQSLTRLVENFS